MMIKSKAVPRGNPRDGLDASTWLGGEKSGPSINMQFQITITITITIIKTTSSFAHTYIYIWCLITRKLGETKSKLEIQEMLKEKERKRRGSFLKSY